MTDPNSESEFEDEGSQEFGPVEDYLAVWDVGNDSISGKIVPNLPEVYSLITRFAEANATRHLPKEMCEAMSDER